MLKRIVMISILSFLCFGCFETKNLNKEYVRVDSLNYHLTCSFCKKSSDSLFVDIYIDSGVFYIDSLKYKSCKYNKIAQKHYYDEPITIVALKSDSLRDTLYTGSYLENRSFIHESCNIAKQKMEADDLYKNGLYGKALKLAESISYKPSWLSKAKYWNQFRPEYISEIKQKKVCIGMSKDEVIASWGKPDDINRTVGSNYVHEQWVYEGLNYDCSYLYFEDGIMTNFQD